ncbi:MAG: glycosyltransferase family 39 protein [Anaerolineales bacterium]|jgi:hypothetical protein|nr:glycosyltransferase family 39 protein [Anaerolineales bacterium]
MLKKLSTSLVFIFLIALALRLGLVIALRAMPIGLDDMFQYDMLARSIVAGDGYRWYAQDDLHLVQNYFTTLEFQIPADYDPRGVLTSFRPPLYPAFLALIYFLTGVDSERFFTARLVQAFLNAGLVPLTFALARRIFPEKKPIAPIAAWIVALYPMLVLYPLALATENLFYVLFLGSVLALTLAVQTRLTRFFLLSGLLLGLTALTRSVILAFAVLVILSGFFYLRERKNIILLALALTLTISPWVIRNSLLYGRPMGIETAMGYSLYVSFHPESSGTFQYGISLDLLPYLDDGERDRVGIEAGRQFIQADPIRALVKLPVSRAGYFFGLERRALQYFYSNNFFGYLAPPWLAVAALLLFSPFVVLASSAAFGLALWPWRRDSFILPLAVAGYTAPHIFLLAEERFHYTLIPLLAILGALCWRAGWDGLRQTWAASRAGKLALSLALLAVVLLFLSWGWELIRDWPQLSQLLGPNGNTTGFPY